MRLKLAEVLVRHDGGVSPFVDYERARSGRGSDIYDAHARLWACYVLVRRDTSEQDEKTIIAFLAREMGVRWEHHEEFGPAPNEWVDRLAIHYELHLPLWSGDDDQAGPLLKTMAAAAARDSKTFANRTSWLAGRHSAP